MAERSTNKAIKDVAAASVRGSAVPSSAASTNAVSTNAAQASAVSAQSAPRGIDSFALKLIAIVAMTCNHAAWVFGTTLPPVLLCIFYAVGGLTFPIMLFLLHVGYEHTRSVRNYALRLFVFALVAQVPYWLFLAHSANVLLTLLMCLGVFYFYDKWNHNVKFWLLFAVIAALSLFCDWGVMGPFMALVLHSYQDKRKRLIYSTAIPVLADGLPMVASFALAPSATSLGLLLYPLLGCSATIPLLLAYNGQRGRSLKWFFYAYYPLHIAVLGCLAQVF